MQMKLSDGFYLLRYFHIHPPPTRERLLNETRAVECQDTYNIINAIASR